MRRSAHRSRVLGRTACRGAGRRRFRKEKAMTRLTAALAMTVLAAGTAGADSKVKEEKVDGYLEWRQGDVLIVDGQKVTTNAGTKFKGKDAATSVTSIPAGY